MRSCPCPYLGGVVELSDERAQHIIDHHPELVSDLDILIAATLSDPDLVRTSTRFGGARRISRWFENLRDGKHVVVVVVSNTVPVHRHWIVTAFIARRLAQGDTEWQRP
jgi:hypothetical protein